MKAIRVLLAAAALVLWVGAAAAQPQVRGQVYSLVYGWENAQSAQQWDTYQGLQFQLKPTSAADLSVRTHLRLARRGSPAEWDERIYNLYGDWSALGGGLDLRLGRQFLFRGVINGSMDALSVRVKPAQGLELQVVGGVATPFDRSASMQSWDAAGVFGSYGSYRFSRLARLDLSYFQRGRSGELVWQQAGTALTGAINNSLFYNAQIDYNLKKSEVQGMRYRLTYLVNRWSLIGEYNNQKPRILEDSFFNIFRLVAFDQVRGGATYQIGPYQVGANLIHTAYSEGDTADEILVTLGGSWGTIGLIYQTGYGGDNVGLYGDAGYEVLPGLSFKLHSSYYNYQRRSLAFGEDATAFSAGVHYRPIRPLLVQAEVQESMNSFFDNDFRALLRLNYTFNTGR